MTPKSRRPRAGPALAVDVGEPPPDLLGVVLRGIAWKGATRVVSSVTRLAVLLVLARLLTPYDYGIAGMAIVVTSLVMIFTDPALAAALVQRPEIDERDRSTIFWMAVAIGALLTILGVAAAGLVADLFGEPEVANLFAVTSLCFFVASLAVAHRGVLLRRLEYRRLEIREMLAVVLGGAVAVAVAFAGYGAWAIIFNYVTYIAVSTVLMWMVAEWRPHFIFSADSARSVTGFSARVLTSNLLAWGNVNVDKALVGRVVGAAALGAYSVAFTAMLVPTTLISQPLHQVVAPAYSRIQNDAVRLQRAWLRSKRMSVAAVVPALFALIVAAPDVVDVLLGDDWDAVTVPLQVLCAGAIANTLTSLNWSILLAKGHAKTLLRVTLLSSVVTWVAFALGLPWGIVGVATGFAVARWLLIVPSTWLTTRALGFDMRSALLAGGAVLPISVAAAAVAELVRIGLVETDVPPLVRLVVVPSSLLLVYGALLWVTLPSVVGEARLFVRHLRQGAEQPA